MIHKVVGEVVVEGFQVGVRSWNGVNRSATNVASGGSKKQDETHEVLCQEPLAHEVCSVFSVAQIGM